MPARALDSPGKVSGGSGSNLTGTTVSLERAYQANVNASTSASNSLRLSASPSPLYSQGHLTVPEWQLGNKVLRLHGTYKPQQKEGTARPGDYTPSSSRSETESIFSASSSSSLTMGGREGGSYSSSDRSTSGGGINGPGGGMLLPSSSNYQYLSPRVPPVSTYHHPHPYVNTHWIIGNDDYKLSSYSSAAGYNSSSSSVTYSQTGANTKTYSGHDQYLTTLPPPPEYPGGSSTTHFSEKGADIRTCRSYEAMDKMDVRRSQPDLRLCASSPGIFIHDVKFQNPQR